MKYIRTKNGIYRTTKNFVVGKEHYVAWHDFCEEIINQADTIKELCDEFVIVDKTCNEIHTPINHKDFDKLDELVLGNRKLYGAIWTDKGLQFVARMNSEGVLELL